MKTIRFIAVAAALALPGAALADTVCGTRAIEKDSVWLMGVAGSGSTTCQLTFINNYGGFTGHCHSIDDSVSPPQQDFGTVAGRMVISPGCAITGDVTVTDVGLPPRVVRLNGWLWSQGSWRPTAGNGVFVASVGGLNVFTSWTMSRRAWDPTLPDVPTAD